MLLQAKTWVWAHMSEPHGESGSIDAELRGYARSFAAPLVALALLGAAALVAAVLLIQPA